MLLDEKAEHRLAFKISASILAILVVVASIISVVFYVLKKDGDQEILTNWLSLVVNDSNFGRLLTGGSADEIDLFYSQSKRIPPSFRNIVIHFNGWDFHVYGPLALAETSELQLEQIDDPIGSFEHNVSDRRFIFFGKKFPDRTIYVYAAQDGELGHFSREMLSIALACLLFTIGLYFVARRIAKRSFAPLKESLTMMGLYNRNIAHELRTPLAVLKSDLELVSAEHPSPHITSALEEAWSIEKIIDSLLFLAENNATGKKDSVSVKTAIKKKLEILERKYPEKLFKVDIKTKKQLVWNPELIEILLGILFENAYIHARNDSTIAIRDTETGIEIENVCDRVIPEWVLAHIFEPFIKFNSGGSGLGLSMARKIAEMHGWQLRILQVDKKISVTLDTQTLSS